METTPVDEEIYQCGTCKFNCKSDPENIEEQSIGCDGQCQLWYHYKCVNIEGNEPFLSKKRMKWYCPECLQKIPKRVKKSKK